MRQICMLPAKLETRCRRVAIEFPAATETLGFRDRGVRSRPALNEAVTGLGPLARAKARQN